MISLKKTSFYDNVLKEINYHFGDIFIFDGFVVSEINEGVHISWDQHTKSIVEDVLEFTGGDGSELIYISHRINSYSVAAMDWLKFYNNSYNLKGHGIISYNKVTTLNIVIESIFFNKKISRFSSLETAIDWARKHEFISN